MVLPESVFKEPRVGPELTLIEGDVVFTRGAKLDDFKRVSRIRDPAMMRALDTYQPREVLKEALWNLQITTESDKQIISEQIIDKATDLNTIGKQIDQVFDPDRTLRRTLSETEYQAEQFQVLGELVEGHTDDEQFMIEQAAAALWFCDEILEEAGYKEVDLLAALKNLYDESDGMYTETAEEALRLAKISVALEQGLLD